MAATQEMVKIAYEVKPDLVTLVPERREELTTEGGLDVAASGTPWPSSSKTCATPRSRSRSSSTPTSTRCAPPTRWTPTAWSCTPAATATRASGERQRELARLVDAAKAAAKLGLGVAAGHGLNYENVQPVVAIAEIDELNIGHAIVARAVLVGLDRAVRDMLALMRRG